MLHDNQRRSVLVTATTNRLHFEDLEPRRFEDLSRDVLLRSAADLQLNSIGRSGNDGGCDLEGVDAAGRLWLVQCKRYKSATPGDARDWAQQLLSSLNTRGHVGEVRAVLTVACDASLTVREAFRTAAEKAGATSVQVLGAGELEGILYNRHKDLLHRYFGISTSPDDWTIGVEVADDGYSVPIVDLTEEVVEDYIARVSAPFIPPPRPSGTARFAGLDALYSSMNAQLYPSERTLIDFKTRLRQDITDELAARLADRDHVLRLRLYNDSDLVLDGVRVILTAVNPCIWQRVPGPGLVTRPAKPLGISALIPADHRPATVRFRRVPEGVQAVFPDVAVRPHDWTQTAPVVLFLPFTASTDQVRLRWSATTANRDGRCLGVFAIDTAPPVDPVDLLPEQGDDEMGGDK